jgi:hypothetical protein
MGHTAMQSSSPLKRNSFVSHEQNIMSVQDGVNKGGAVKTTLREQYGGSSDAPGKTLEVSRDASRLLQTLEVSAARGLQMQNGKSLPTTTTSGFVRWCCAPCSLRTAAERCCREVSLGSWSRRCAP